MREAIVSIQDSAGEALGVDGVVSEFEAAGLDDVEVLSCDGSRGVVRAEVDELLDEERMSNLPAVIWFERVSRSGDGYAYVVEFDADESPNMTDACADDLLICGVSDLSEEGVTFDVAGPQSSISDTITAYEQAGANVTLEALREYESRSSPLDELTARQQEVLEVAHDSGYFDVPRSATTDEIAGELGLDDSTVAEHLQRAERNLVSSVI